MSDLCPQPRTAVALCVGNEPDPFSANSIGYLSYGLAKQEEGYRNGGEDDLGEGWDHRLMHQVHLDALENQLECLTSTLEEAGKDERIPPKRIGDPPRRWVDEGEYGDD